jgi:regulator of RNase E activity RraA
MEFSETENRELLAAFESLRVADVRDGLDTLGLHWCGSAGPAVRPILRVRAHGIARTCRYLPYAGPPPTLTGEAYWEWSAKYYREVCSYPWIPRIRPGDFIVIDQSGVDAGLMGSNNTLDCLRRGARGFVSNGGVRDSDELIAQGVPFWSAAISQKMVQLRLQFDAQDVPVAIAGARVEPGDVVVADGDGVIAVPRRLAPQVAREGQAEHRRDRAARRKHYQALGLPLDPSVALPEGESEA